MPNGKRRFDRITSPEFLDGLHAMDLSELRSRRDACREELEHLSMLRRFVQGRAEILKGELDRRNGDGHGSLLDNLAEILAAGDHEPSSRGAAIELRTPDDEMLLARRRVEKLVAESGLTDPTALTDSQIRKAVDELRVEEHSVSADRADVIRVLDQLQEELKRRYKEDPASVLA